MRCDAVKYNSYIAPLILRTYSEASNCKDTGSSTTQRHKLNSRWFTLNIYLFYLFPEFRMQPYNKKAENTIQYMHTWILKDECVTTYIAPIKQKMHLINTMSVHGIIWRRVVDTRINRMSIWSKERNRFSLVYIWSALKSGNQQDQGWDCSIVL